MTRDDAYSASDMMTSRDAKTDKDFIALGVQPTGIEISDVAFVNFPLTPSFVDTNDGKVYYHSEERREEEDFGIEDDVVEDTGTKKI